MPSYLAVGRALTDVASIGLLRGRAIRERELLTEQLQTTLNDRRTVEQAKGILAQRRDVTVNKASEPVSYTHLTLPTILLV